MSCDCAQTAFAEYFTDEGERLQKQILDFPETFKDVWSSLAIDQQDAVGAEALTAVAQGVLSNTSIEALIDLLKTEVESALTDAQMPRFESALAELSQVRDTQEAVKVLAGIVFILWSDSIFHVMNILAKKIVRLCALKITQVAQLRAAIAVGAAAASVFDAAGVDSQDVRDLLVAAAADVSEAETLVNVMRGRAAQSIQIQAPLITRATLHLQDALDKLVDEDVDAELVRSGATAALLASTEPLAMATGGMLLASLYIKEIRSVTSGLETTNRQISASMVAFRAGVDQYRTAPMTNYQLSILNTVHNRLAETRGEMTSAAATGSMSEIAFGLGGWVSSIGVAQRMLTNLPPEIRAQESLNTTLLAAYNETCRQIDSIDGDHITNGAETTTDLVAAVNRLIYMMENLFSQVQTGAIADHAAYLGTSSSGLPFSAIDYVVAEMSIAGLQLQYRVGSGAVTGQAAWGALVPAIARLDESVIQATLVSDAMAGFLAEQPPENALITTLLELLKVLQMGRGRDLLMMGNITEFMDSSPLNWSYLGNAVDCIKQGMTAALDAGQTDIYDQLDTLLEPMMAKIGGLEMRMQRESAYSLNTILDKLKAQIESLDSIKETLTGFMDKVDC